MRVKMTTSLGSFVLELNEAKAPISSKNFLEYVDAGTYDGTIFHRVISNFMVQGGGYTTDMSRKPTNAPIANEYKNGLKNVRGSIAMARLGGQPDSATNQFFINVVDNAFLDKPQDGAGYAVFGMVVEGMETIDKIRAVKTGTKAGMGDVPTQPIVIVKAERVVA